MTPGGPGPARSAGATAHRPEGRDGALTVLWVDEVRDESLGARVSRFMGESDQRVAPRSVSRQWARRATTAHAPGHTAVWGAALWVSGAVPDPWALGPRLVPWTLIPDPVAWRSAVGYVLSLIAAREAAAQVTDEHLRSQLTERAGQALDRVIDDYCCAPPWH